jgi:hypothetical protein
MEGDVVKKSTTPEKLEEVVDFFTTSPCPRPLNVTAFLRRSERKSDHDSNPHPGVRQKITIKPIICGVVKLCYLQQTIIV